MFKDWRERGQRLLRSRPGHRFQDYHAWCATRDRAGAVKELMVALALLGAGAVMLITPGPGIVTILAGLGVLAGRAHTLACGLDHAELALRRLLVRCGIRLPR